MRRLVLFALVTSAACFGQSAPPTPAEIAQVYRSIVSEHGFRILFWEKRFATRTIRDVRGWDIRFKYLNSENIGPVLKQKYLGTAERRGECHEYEVIQISPMGPPPRYVKSDVQVDGLGRVKCK